MKRVFAIIVGGFVLSAPAAFAASVGSHIKEGNELYKSGNYEASAEKFNEALKKIPESDVVNFNLGTALYKKGDYGQAVEHLQKSLLTEDEQLKQKSFYNLGNSLYKNGVAREESDLNFAVDSLEKSLKQYEQAMSLDAKDTDAKNNYEFVQKELERLKKKQEEQKQQNQEKQGNQRDQQRQQEQNQNNQDNQQDKQNQQSAQNENQKQENEEQEAQENNQEQQEKENQGEENKDQSNPEQNPQNSQAQSTQGDYNKEQLQPKDSHQLTEKEAQMLLDRYQQKEEPKELLNLQMKHGSVAPVLKDW